jgi:hypothetical protein
MIYREAIRRNRMVPAANHPFTRDEGMTRAGIKKPPLKLLNLVHRLFTDSLKSGASPQPAMVG